MPLKTAVILHGNLRTFLMPLRENPSIRVCDVFYENVLKPNNSDLFIVTDITDFYCNRIYESAKETITSELKGFLGDSIKEISVLDPIDVTTDQKYIILKHSPDIIPERIPDRVKGSVPANIVNQYLKIKFAYDLLKKYEQANSVHYDIIFRGRFDNYYEHRPLNFTSFDFNTNDIFTPGPGAEHRIVYDWAALGSRKAMDLALNLYDQLGNTLSNRFYICRHCGIDYCGELDLKKCNCNDTNNYIDSSLASEYHLYRLFKDNNLKYAMGFNCLPYRY